MRISLKYEPAYLNQYSDKPSGLMMWDSKPCRA